MFMDVIDLRDFYASPRGQAARRVLRNQLRTLWPSVKGETVLGLGYATPYLGPFLDDADQILALMPAAQGVESWPRDGRNRVALSQETEIPLPDLSVDKILLVHAVETTENLRGMLRECWRVLKGNGRMLLLVPNRHGLWSMADSTPFGQGHPFSRSQMTSLLRDTLFQPTRQSRGLYLPPSRSRLVLRAAGAWEKLGHRWFSSLGGVNLVEAEKQIYAGSLHNAPARRRILVPVPSAATTAAARSRNETTSPRDGKPES
ncbi:MAG: class I SAM-dependent methyltransferase [Alphaproteobacteria bacterium]|nr:class I SAM-dependent methyltransferase [Alphaproteobacteria bacterium]